MNQAINDSIHRRGREIEDAFFRNLDEELLRKMREDADRDLRRQDMIRYSGLPDSPLIDELIRRDFTPGTLASLMLLPAVLVAWADGTVHANERQAILHAVLEKRFGEAEEIRQMVSHWLREKPTGDLWSLWQSFASALYDSMPPKEAAELADRVYQLAKEVAEAAGGLFNRGKITEDEQLVLDEIAELR